MQHSCSISNSYPPAENVEILSGLPTESEKTENLTSHVDSMPKVTGQFFNRLIGVAQSEMVYVNVEMKIPH